MSDVGDVHYALDLISVVAQYPDEQIHKDVRPQISYMGVLVYRRTAGIYPDLSFLDRTENFLRSR